MTTSTHSPDEKNKNTKKSHLALFLLLDRQNPLQWVWMIQSIAADERNFNFEFYEEIKDFENGLVYICNFKPNQYRCDNILFTRYSDMIYSIVLFYTIIILYHIISIITLHIRWYENITTLSLLRDLWRVAIVAGTAIRKYKYIIPFFRQRKYPIILSGITILSAIILSLYQGTSWYNIFIGIKYGYMFLWILLSALFVWRTLNKEQKEKITKTIPKIIIITIVVGFVRQMLKYIRPDFFFHIGYGPIGDFIFGQEPPVYYRTGPGWEPRLQGLFAWPNNYGYFLAAFFPLILYTFQQQITKNKKLLWMIAIIITITSVLLTLSRTAWIGTIIGAILIYATRFRQHKKILRSILIVATIGIVWLSILKWWSTQEHIIQKLSSMQYVIDKPLGYGLGSSWPAIHHEGTMLPENYYIQIAIDTGTVWAILLLLTLITFMYSIKTYNKKNESKPLIIWFFILLVMGLFLHVFEDSMVNYIFFITRGLYIWYKSKENT